MSNQNAFGDVFWFDSRNSYDSGEGEEEGEDPRAEEHLDHRQSVWSDRPTGGGGGGGGDNGGATERAVTTIGDAMSMLTDRFESQIEKAVENLTPFNTPIRGDGEARIAFYTLLPVPHQRRFFLKIASAQRSWPRLRSLFGAPPYGFLHAQDSAMLNATGIARTRAHMAYEEERITNYSQFGAGQLTDEYSREYRVVDTAATESDILPSSLSLTSSSNNRVQFIVRVKKRSKQERIRRMKDQFMRKTILFPVTGDVIVLRETKRLLKLQGRSRDTSNQNAFKVLQVRPRDMNASTASVLAMRA